MCATSRPLLPETWRWSSPPFITETTGDYVIVNTRTPEFHYATAGDENVFVHYEGEGGIELNSIWRRLLFALRFGEYRILFSGEITKESRIMFNRQIADRIKKIAPSSATTVIRMWC